MDSTTAVPHVVAVDDSALNLKLLRNLLEKQSYRVTTCQDPQDAMRIFLEDPPDLILLDVMMPGLDGLAVLALIQGHHRTSGVPVIMVTARTGGDDVETALDRGAFDYVKKPIEAVETLARVRSALRYRRQQIQLAEMATYDSMTKLFNHGILIDLLNRELLVAVRSQTPTAYFMLDADHFKLINDRHGHQVGDEVLIHLAQVLRDSVRRTDSVGRYGGEEFGVVLPNCGEGPALELAERIRSRIDASPVPTGGGVRVSVSIGVATVPAGAGTDFREVVRRADRALYRAKEGGRNRVELWSAGAEDPLRT